MDSMFHAVCDHSNIGIALVRIADLSFEYLNEMAREILAIGLGENIKGFRLDQLFASEDVGMRAFSPTVLAVNDFNDNVFFQKFDGSGFIANLSVRMIEHQGQEFHLLTFRDVTADLKVERELLTKQEELHQTYEDLLKQNKELAALDKMKDKFIALTTHELRTPASAILATADLLDQGLFDSEEELREYIKTMLNQSQHLLDIVNDILDFSKIQAGKLEFYVEELDLGEILGTVANGLTQYAAENHLTIQFEKPAPMTCFFDRMRMTQVFTNIMSNAIKFNRPGGDVRVWLEKKNGFVIAYIKDGGVGIPADKADKVFNEFETVGNIDTHHKGTGLGMPISKRLMTTIGGEIGFESEVNVGTTFFLRVPATRVLGDEFYGERPRRDEAA